MRIVPDEFARFAFECGEVLYTLKGEATGRRTRDSIEIGPGEHVEEPSSLFINHSFSPNMEVRGREFVALGNIVPGDEVTFNYLASESEISSPFVCHDTGRPVESHGGAGPRHDAPAPQVPVMKSGPATPGPEPA